MNAALRALGLPYERVDAQIRRLEPGVLAYDAEPAPGATPLRLHARVRAGQWIPTPSDLEVWLTGRWNAYTRRGGRLWRVPVAHQPWPLRSATVEELDTDVFTVLGLPAPDGPPLAHASPGVSTVLGAPRPSRRSQRTR